MIVTTQELIADKKGKPMSVTPATDRYTYSMAEAAAKLGVSDDTLERHIRPHLLTGRITSYKIGSRRVIVWSSLITFLEEEHDGALPGYHKGVPR